VSSIFEVKTKNFNKNGIFASSNKAGALAQLVEQRTENPCVAGSIPAGTTPFKTPDFSGVLAFLEVLVFNMRIWVRCGIRCGERQDPYSMIFL
jgi:hypothetical protein